MKNLFDKFQLTGEYLLSVMAGIGFGVLGYAFLESVIGYQNFLAVRIAGTVWYLFTVCLFVGLKSAHIAYKQKKFNWKESVVSILPVWGVQLLVGLFLGFPMYISGAGFHLGLLLYAGGKEVTWFPDVPLLCYFIGTLMSCAICFLALVAGQKIGYRKRLKDCNKLFTAK